MKLNLSRAAKKMRLQELEPHQAPRIEKKPPTKPAPQAPPAEPAPEPVAVTAEPVVATPAPAATAPKKAWPVKAKRPRFVRPKTERWDRATAAPLPVPSMNVFARLMTKNLAIPPKDDATKPLR